MYLKKTRTKARRSRRGCAQDFNEHTGVGSRFVPAADLKNKRSGTQPRRAPQYRARSTKVEKRSIDIWVTSCSGNSQNNLLEQQHQQPTNQKMQHYFTNTKTLPRLLDPDYSTMDDSFTSMSTIDSFDSLMSSISSIDKTPLSMQATPKPRAKKMGDQRTHRRSQFVFVGWGSQLGSTPTTAAHAKKTNDDSNHRIDVYTRSY